LTPMSAVMSTSSICSSKDSSMVGRPPNSFAKRAMKPPRVLARPLRSTSTSRSLGSDLATSAAAGCGLPGSAVATAPSDATAFACSDVSDVNACAVPTRDESAAVSTGICVSASRRPGPSVRPEAAVPVVSVRASEASPGSSTLRRRSMSQSSSPATKRPKTMSRTLSRSMEGAAG
jgi:hypothetical protein